MKDENEMIRKISSSVSFRLEFLFNPKHFFPSENISIRRKDGKIVYIRNWKRQFFFFFISRETSIRLRAARNSKTRGGLYAISTRL